MTFPRHSLNIWIGMVCAVTALVLNSPFGFSLNWSIIKMSCCALLYVILLLKWRHYSLRLHIVQININLCMIWGYLTEIWNIDKTNKSSNTYEHIYKCILWGFANDNHTQNLRLGHISLLFWQANHGFQTQVTTTLLQLQNLLLRLSAFMTRTNPWVLFRIPRAFFNLKKVLS